MFGFLKKKLKESVESLKKAFSNKEDKKEEPAKELEPLSDEQEKVMEEVTEEVREEVQEEAKEGIPEALEEAEELKEIVDEIKEDLAETKEEIEEVKEETKEELKELKEEAKEKTEETREEIEKAEETAEEIEKKEQEPKKEEKPKKEGFLKKLFGKKKSEKKEPKEEPEKEEKPKEKKEEKKSLFGGLFEKVLSEKDFEKFFANLEILLLESNLAYEVIQLLRERLKDELVDKKIQRGKGEEILFKTIENTFREILLEGNPQDIIEYIRKNKAKGEPTKFLFLGVNGVGKTTSLAKLCYWLKKQGFSCVLAASDTFRAASIEQLEKHASMLDVNVIKHKYGGDPAAVAFDAIEHAKSKGIDCVLIDSAGRQHTSSNLMEELKKLERVAKPDFRIFVADAMTGNDAVEQAREFGEQVGFDMSILGKADVDQKGGAILSVSYVSGKPVVFLGIGQDYKDLEAFDKEKLLKRIF